MNENLEIAIEKIQELDFHVNEDIELNGDIQFYLQFETRGDAAKGKINIDVRSVFHLKDKPGSQVLTHTARTVFQAKDLSKFCDSDGKLNLPEQYATTLLGIAITHARALLSQTSARSRFGDLIIPIVNPTNCIET